MAKAFNSLGALGREMLENAVILLVEDREDDVLIIARKGAVNLSWYEVESEIRDILIENRGRRK